MSLREGRLGGGVHPALEKMNVSIAYDRRLAAVDIDGSRAHAHMLAARGLLGEAERDAILAGLDAVAAEIAAGTFEWRESDEDVHMNIERALTAITPAGARLHAARSRNDQVALDQKLYTAQRLTGASERLGALIAALCDLAGRHLATLMPAYTHLVRGQPTTFAHYLAAHAAMLSRDRRRARECRALVMEECPLGAGAGTTTTLAIDPALTAAELGFSRPFGNSLDAVSDRDFAAHFAFVAAQTMAHLSRLAEDLILFASAEYAFVTLGDRVATTSSMMPQKKNPDALELVRGKTARAIGDLTALLTLQKGLPMSYDRDLQEVQEALFDAADTLDLSLEAMRAVVENLFVDRERCRAAAADPASFLTATDLAERLVEFGIPFREAHALVAAAVRDAAGRGVGLDELGAWGQRDARLTGFDPGNLSLEASLARRRVPGGPAPDAVRRSLEQLRAEL